MIQHRGQAAILLARMNRSSKQLRYYGNTQMDLVPSAIAELMPTCSNGLTMFMNTGFHILSQY